MNVAAGGWTSDGRDRLKCGRCGAKWGLGGLAEIRDEKVQREVVRRLGSGIGDRHGKGCAWRVRTSPGE